jgi:hypothetical protein
MPEIALFNDFSVFEKTPAGVYEINDILWALRSSSNSKNVYVAMMLFLTDEEGEQWEESLFASSLVSKEKPGKPAQLQICPSEDGKTPVMGLSEEALMKLGTGKAAFGEGEEEQCRGEYFVKFNKKASPGMNAGKVAQKLIELLGDAYDQSNASSRFFNGMKFLFDRQPDKKNPEYDTFLPTQLIENPNGSGAKKSASTAKKSTPKEEEASPANEGDALFAQAELSALLTDSPVSVTRLIPQLTAGKSTDERSILLTFIQDVKWLSNPDQPWIYDAKTKTVKNK